MRETTAPAGLQSDGFRFVGRGGEFRWVHKLETIPGDLDCTDMTDAEFELVARAQVNQIQLSGISGALKLITNQAP